MSPTVIEIVVKSSGIVAVAAVAAGLMRRKASAASRHLVWSLAVAGLLVLPVGSIVLPAWNIPIARQMPAVAVPPPLEITSASVAASQVTVAAPVQKEPASAPISWLALLPFAYAAGVVFLLGRLGAAYWKTRRILSRTTRVDDEDWTTLLEECAARLGVRRSVRLVRSREETMPMTCGVRRPAIVLPSVADMWGNDRRRAVLLHELAHVVRFDCPTQSLAELAVALYWPHPAVWLTARQLRVERELACDDCVLSCGTEPREYAGHLLEIAHSLGPHRAPALAVGMARPRQLEGRMMAMLDAARNRSTPTAHRRLLALALAVAVVAPLAAATVVSAPVAPESSRSTPSAVSSALATGAVAVAHALAQKAETATMLTGGTWQIRLAADGRQAHLTVSVEPNSSYSTTIVLDRIDGLAAILTGPGGPAHYTLKRDAGTFEFDGVVRAGAGGGTFSFAPSTTFGDELARRGFSRPTALELGTLAWSDIGLAFIDDLSALKYARPTLQQLVNAARHGVTRSYLREMSDLGYRVGTIDALVDLRNHGVDAAFVRGMASQGMARLSADELVRARNHGVDPQFIQGLRALGYELNMDQLVDARNHGVDPRYIQNLQALGFKSLSLGDLVNARNHGVDPGYVTELRELGYQLRLDELIDARNHGVDPGFIREMASAGYQHPSMADLIRMRNHGVNAKTVERLKSRGYDHPSIDRLIELQSRGARAEPPTVGPMLNATGGIHQSLKIVWRDIDAALQRWADRWLR
jgi:beta-lactamase regulating signal transducer with metallopeptidase domain